jgi:hypothetical protein
MSRLVSMFMLWLLLLLAAAPASAVMDVQPRNCTWELPASSYDLAPDVRDGPNLYAYVQQNPWSKFDADGLWAEDLALGIPSLGVGIASLASNIKKGHVGEAIWDGVGIVADAAAVLLPGVPGGVGLGTKAARLAAAQNKVENTIDTAETVAEVGAAVATGDATALVDVAIDKAMDRAMGGGRKARGGNAPGPKGQKQTNAVADAAVNAVKTGGKNFDQARREGFEKAGMTNPDDVKFTKVDPKTGTVVEFKGKDGAKVAYDGPHDSPGPHHDSPHVGWQTGGKRSSGGTQRANIPYEGPQHPSRSSTKGEGDVEPH